MAQSVKGDEKGHVYSSTHLDLEAHGALYSCNVSARARRGSVSTRNLSSSPGPATERHLRVMSSSCVDWAWNACATGVEQQLEQLLHSL